MRAFVRSKGCMTVNSQPRVCGRPSTDPDFGFESLHIGLSLSRCLNLVLGEKLLPRETKSGIRSRCPSVFGVL